ncbi:hypothetical protein HJFPF1_06144 [Paramyrothecium foliicola]|nr:hypothetical protein HJFPF1_06144 [Paramyrothecium foliicola]
MSNDSGPASDSPTPNRRGKKRVGFHASAGSATNLDVVDYSNEGGISPLASPRLPPGTTPPGAPDARELSLALTKILSSEQGLSHERPDDLSRANEGDDESPLGEQEASLTPRRPRPALRRNTSYDVPEEREKADLAEQLTSERQLRSITDARQRANRLAMSIGSHSAPGSRRNSDEVDATFQPLISDSDDHGISFKVPSIDAVNPSVDTREFQDQHVRYRPTRARQAHGSPEPYLPAAEKLVRSHTSRHKKDLFHPELQGRVSGTATPILHQSYAHDYVPRPAKYRGGILSSLLKLYQDDRGSGNTSGYNTPSAPATPLMSPRASPPTSRPASVTGSPRSRSPRPRPSSSLFNYHRAHHSTSSLALTELMKSSSMFAAPGSKEVYDQWNDKIKKETPPHKPKKEQIRITVHIAGIMSRHRYLIKLCRALMMYGAPTHRLEEYMTMSSRVLEIEGQFLYMPSCMIISFDDSTTHTTEVKLVRVPQGVDLGRLRDVHNIYKDVVHDKLGVEEATKRLDVVMTQKNKFPTWFRVLMYGVASVCVAPFAFQGRFIDLPIAFLLGCLVGVLQLVFAPSNELYAHVFEVSAAVITSFLARGFGSIRNGELFCFSALAQSSIALILPGYMVLCSSLELQSQKIVAGSVRMVHALIYTLFLGYGITIGASLYGMMDSNATSATTCNKPLERGWYFLFVPGFTMCLCIVNQAKWRQTPVMLFMSTAGFAVNSYCSMYFGANTEGSSQISNMLGALTIGILANLYSRLGGHVENARLDFLEWWDVKVAPRFFRKKRRASWPLPSFSDPESSAVPPMEKPERRARHVGYSLAAAAMLPAIFVQVPSGIAAGGSLLAGVTSADKITNSTIANANNIGRLDGTAFNVLFSVIQVAVGISVGLFMSALIVYPLGKRRSGLFSF